MQGLSDAIQAPECAERAGHRPPPAAFTIEGAMDFSGLTRSRLYELMSAGDLEAAKLAAGL